MVVYVTFLRDVVCQKLLNSANVSRSYSQNNTGTVFFETRCRTHWRSGSPDETETTMSGISPLKQCNVV